MQHPPRRFKRKNDTEMFYDEHTLDFDRRAKGTTPDPMKAVEDHYDTAPKLKNELKRRRSLAEPRILKPGDRHMMKRQAINTDDCPTCQCLKRLSDKKKLKLKKACHCSKKQKNKSLITAKKRGLDIQRANLHSSKFNIQKLRKPAGSTESRAARSGVRSSEASGNLSRFSERTSITSYFSYGSMAHEPMCDE